MGLWDAVTDFFTGAATTAPQATVSGAIGGGLSPNNGWIQPTSTPIDVGGATSSGFGGAIGSALSGNNQLFNTLVAGGLAGAGQLQSNDLAEQQLQLAAQKLAQDQAQFEAQLAQALEVAKMNADVQAGIAKRREQNAAFTNLVNGNLSARTNEATALRDFAQLMQGALK